MYNHIILCCFIQFDYFNSLLINTVDEDGNPVPLGGEFPLEGNEHFNKLPVNTQMSNIQVPTNVYNRGTEAGTHTLPSINGLIHITGAQM